MNLIKGFLSSVEKYPQKTAVIVSDVHYTYSQLQAASNAVAYRLMERGIGKNDFVGVLMKKGAAAVAGFLGCLKVGAIYVPMSLRDPGERLNKILQNCNIKTVICRQTPTDLQPVDVLALKDEEIFSPCETPPVEEFPHPTADAHDVAYVLHTSGSTGIPKGVQTTHENICSFINWTGKILNTSGSDVFGNHAPFIFDLSTLDIYGAFAVGGTVVLSTEREMMDASLLVGNIKRHGITTWYSVPSILTKMLEDGKWPEITSLRSIIFAGEPYPVNKNSILLSSTPAHCSLYNFYGPTETNVCTYYRVPRDFPSHKPIPIGKAIDQSIKTEIKDNQLIIHGPCVMKGYVGRPDLSEKIYATGDLVLTDETGNLLLTGRKDNQVKIRGNRVELGEIENTLLKWDKIEAAVVTTEMKDGQKYLRAHVQLKKGIPGISLIQLKTFCRRSLPIYMIPHCLHVWEQLPLNQNGKIERQLLGSDQWKTLLKN